MQVPTDGRAEFLSAAFDGMRYAVVWDTVWSPDDGDGGDVHFASFDVGGTPATVATLLAGGAGAQTDPDVVAGPAGWVVAYADGPIVRVADVDIAGAVLRVRWTSGATTETLEIRVALLAP